MTRAENPGRITGWTAWQQASLSEIATRRFLPGDEIIAEYFSFAGKFDAATAPMVYVILGGSAKTWDFDARNIISRLNHGP